MQPVKMIIPGNYIDSQIYRGRLYLWTFNGSLEIYDWDRLVEGTQEYMSNKILMRISYIEGSLLYRKGVYDLIADDDFRRLIQEKLVEFSTTTIRIDDRNLEQALISKQSFPGNEEPIETAIYSSKLYFATDSGLYKCEVHKPKRNKSQISGLKKIWDCRLLSFDTSKYGQIALCGGNDGLFELNNTPAEYSNMKPVNYPMDFMPPIEDLHKNKYDPIFSVSNNHSTFANYSLSNIYSSSLIDSSYLSVFTWVDSIDSQQYKNIRKQYRDIQQNEIFGTTNGSFISWGYQEKIYMVKSDSILVCRIKKRKEQRAINDLFEPIKEINIQPWKGKLVSAGVSYFGVICEYENALVLLLSGGETLTIPGRVSKWRVFPRSINYENQLHVINDDNLTICSFYNDYFSDQHKKDYGVQYQSNEFHLHIRAM